MGFGLAFTFFPHAAKDQTRQPAVAGLTATAARPQIASAPELTLNLALPQLTAKAALAYDLESASILYATNLDAPLPIASLTKLMTALIVMDNARLDDVVTVLSADTKVVGINLGLSSGEQLTVKNLLAAMLIPSSNNAALALAQFVSGDESAFVELMNQKAQTLGLAATRFSNPVGWDSDDNYSTAVDLIKIVKEFLKYPDLADIVKTPQLQIASIDGQFVHQLLTTNQLLLTNPEVVGIKTGFTSKALGNLIVMALHNSRRIVTVVLDSSARETDSEKLLGWVENVYRW